MTTTIVGLGEILWDLLPSGKQLGGAPANFAYHAKALGLTEIDSYIISSIGNDILGNELLCELDTLGVKSKYLHRSNTHKTGEVSVKLDQQGIPDYCIKNHVAWDFIPEISFDSQQTIDAVCFGTLAQRSSVSETSIGNFLSNLPVNCLKMFDANLRQNYFSSDIIYASLKLANCFKINHDELSIISKLFGISGNEKQQLSAFSDRFKLKFCILTKGAAGSLIFSEGKFYIHAGFNVSCKDTIGAGDAFTASCTLGLLKNFDTRYINECANQVAAFVCTTDGATPKIPENLINLFN